MAQIRQNIGKRDDIIPKTQSHKAILVSELLRNKVKKKKAAIILQNKTVHHPTTIKDNAQKSTTSLSKMKMQYSNHNINQLASNLYPKLDELETNQEQQTPTPKKDETKLQIKWRLDEQTKLRKFENDTLMKKAQRELDKRIRNRILIQYKKLQAQSQVNYAEIYKRFKTEGNEKKTKNLFTPIESVLQPSQLTERNPEGLSFFSELKSKLASLSQVKEKLRNKSLSSQSKVISESTLKILQSRKKKQTKPIHIKQKWCNDDYQQQLHTISQISNRLKKIYTRKNVLKLHQISQSELDNSKILKQQIQILNDLNQKDKKLSKQNKQQLMGRFHQILNIFSHSLTSRRLPKQLLIDPHGELKRSRLMRVKTFSMDTGSRIQRNQNSKEMVQINKKVEQEQGCTGQKN